jgi:hypothetical protein
VERRPILIAAAVIALVAIIAIAWIALGGLGSGDPAPSPSPSDEPSASPTASPTAEPSVSEEPTSSPTRTPTPEPSAEAGRIEVAWSAASGIDPTASITKVRFMDGRWIAVGSVAEDLLGAAIWTSDDGATWTRAEIGDTREPDQYTQVLDVAALDGGPLVAIGAWGVVPSDQFSRAIWISTDGGATWTETRQQAGALNAVIAGGPGLVAAESPGGGIGPVRGWVATSTDGLTWERLPMTFEANLLAMAMLGDRLVTAGSITTASGESDAAAWYSDDGGTNWTTIELPDGGVPEQVLALVPIDGGLIGTGDAASAWVTADGAAWEHATIADSAYAGAVAVVDGGFVAVGNLIGQDVGEGQSWTSTDGLAWETGVPFGTPNVRFAAATGDGTTVVAGGGCASTTCDAVLWFGEVTADE